jgi:ribosomal protein L11 methylase PrmA
MAEALCAMLEPEGRLALTGILTEQSPRVVECFAPWCVLEVSARRAEWVLLDGTRGNHGA